MARSPGRSLFLRMSRRIRSPPTSKTAFSTLRFQRPRAPRRRRSRLRQLPHSCQVSGRVFPGRSGPGSGQVHPENRPPKGSQNRLFPLLRLLPGSSLISHSQKTLFESPMLLRKRGQNESISDWLPEAMKLVNVRWKGIEAVKEELIECTELDCDELATI